MSVLSACATCQYGPVSQTHLTYNRKPIDRLFRHQATRFEIRRLADGNQPMHVYRVGVTAITGYRHATSDGTSCAGANQEGRLRLGINLGEFSDAQLTAAFYKVQSTRGMDRAAGYEQLLKSISSFAAGIAK